MVDVDVLVPSAVLVAVITEVPADTAVTRPELLTVATEGVALDQVTVWVEPEGRTVGVSWRVAPMTTLAVVGATATDATASAGERVMVGASFETV